MESLRKLGEVPEFQAYLAAIEAQYESLAKQLTECSSFEEYHRVLGALNAYEAMFRVHDLVVRKADELDVNRSESAERQRTADEHARALFLASRLWQSGVPVRDEQ